MKTTKIQDIKNKVIKTAYSLLLFYEICCQGMINLQELLVFIILNECLASILEEYWCLKKYIIHLFV